MRASWSLVAALTVACSSDRARTEPPTTNTTTAMPAPTAVTAASAAATATVSAAPGAAAPGASAPATAVLAAAPAGSARGVGSGGEVPTLAGVPLTVPATIKPGERRPFILYLHGLGASGKAAIDALKVPQLAAERRFVYAAPDGALDSKKQRYWDATSSCCDFDRAGLDHVEALRRLLAQAAAHPSVDPARVFVIGFSNGGFMAQRLACEVPGIAAVASLAGAGPSAGEVCQPPGPVAVLQVHGDKDDVIAYEGGLPLKRADRARHPSAPETVAGWAQRDGCKGAPASAGTMDLDDRLPDAETTVLRYGGCQRPVELWTVRGAGHFVAMQEKGQQAVVSFLERSSK